MILDINFFYTLAKISATLIGLVFVALVSFYFPHVLKLRDDLVGFNPFLKIRFPDYLIIITTSNMTILLLALLISFNFILNDALSRLILDIFFTFYISVCFYFTFRTNKRFFLGSSIGAITKQIGIFKFYRVVFLPPLIFLISLIAVFVLNIPEIRIKINFSGISSILILFGIGIILFDIYAFQAEKLFFQFDQRLFLQFIKDSIKKAYNDLTEKIRSLPEDNKQKETVEELCRPIKILIDSFDIMEKSNIVIAGFLINAKEAFFALKGLSKKSQYAKFFSGFGVFEEKEKNEGSNHN